MKNVVAVFSFLFLSSLSGCFWNSEKEVALEAVKQKLESDFLTESKESLDSKPIFQRKFVTSVSNKTELNVESEKSEDGITTVVIKAKIVSEFGRYNLREVLAKQNETRDTNFNGADALTLILRTVKTDAERFQNRMYSVTIDTNNDSKVLSVKKLSPP